MRIPERSAADAAQIIADILGREEVPYAIGGALALAVAGVPRGTADVDINVFVDDDAVPSVIDVLMGLGIKIDRSMNRMVGGMLALLQNLTDPSHAEATVPAGQFHRLGRSASHSGPPCMLDPLSPCASSSPSPAPTASPRPTQRRPSGSPI